MASREQRLIARAQKDSSEQEGRHDIKHLAPTICSFTLLHTYTKRLHELFAQAPACSTPQARRHLATYSQGGICVDPICASILSLVPRPVSHRTISASSPSTSREPAPHVCPSACTLIAGVTLRRSHI